MASRPAPTPAGATIRRVTAIAATALPVLAADAATKAWARTELADAPVQAGWLDLRLGYNSGVAFGIGAGAPGWLVLALTGAMVAVLAVVALRMRPPVAAGLVLGGGLANLLDRAGDGTVTDFLSVGWWPTFNLADAAIVAGAAWLLLGELLPSRRPRAAEQQGPKPSTMSALSSTAEELQAGDLPNPGSGVDAVLDDRDGNGR
ncbi:signal peptidase II [Georgenia yuyongxinii]